MAMSSFLLLKSDAVPDLGLDLHLGPKLCRRIWLIVSSFSVESIKGRVGPWWVASEPKTFRITGGLFTIVTGNSSSRFLPGPPWQVTLGNFSWVGVVNRHWIPSC